MEQTYIITPVGTLLIKGTSDGITNILFTEENRVTPATIPKVLKEGVRQLHEYFKKERTQFSLQLAPTGTEFQQRVWKELQTIAFGKTTSYQQMANQLGDPKVIRASANANGKNPIAIVIPCHRVIGSDGSLTGYAGGLHRKKWLLAHESSVKQGILF
jgi:methylated-DNA-[protein]-cysteine S-methyltransferase